MFSHKLSMDVNLSIVDAQLNTIKKIDLPNEVEVPDDYIDFLIKEANGVLLKKQSIPFRSFTRQFMAMLDYSLCTDAGTEPVTSSTNNKLAVSSKYTFMHMAPAAADSSYGILVGTSSVAMNYKDWTLYGPCTHGSGVNQFSYAAPTFDNITISGSIHKITARRVVTNLNASSINVKECGVVTTDVASSNYKILVCRDTIQYDNTPIDVTVAQNQSLEVVYNFYIDTANGFTSNFVTYLHESMKTTNSSLVPLHGVSTVVTYINTDLQYSTLRMNSAQGVTPVGICVGSDATTYVTSSTNYRLGNMIPHGSSSGQLVYGPTTYSTYTASVANQCMTSYIIRRFTNNSGGTVQIREVGIISPGLFGAGSTAGNNILIYRKETGVINLLDGQSLDAAFAINISSSIL